MATLSHEELSLLLFTLEGENGATDAPLPSSESCEDACPIIESIEQTLCGHDIPLQTQLARHLNNHLRDSLLQSGVFEVIAERGAGNQTALSDEEQERLRQANERLKSWTYEINFSSDEQRLLREGLAQLPRSAWLTMPRTLWRLRKKLSAR